MYSIFKPLLFNIDPEAAHNLALKAIKFNFIPESFFKVEEEELLKIDLFNKKFPNPIGLAAGFDKSAEAFNEIYKLGFGFIELGTVTPKKQYGNEKPRIFRLEEDRALINRLGFNNEGIDIVRERIMNNRSKGIMGINIGPNMDTQDQKDDFCKGLKNFFDIADYLTVNISSPNTKGLRDFHAKDKLYNLLNELNIIKKNNNSSLPLFLKISPDIEDESVEDIISLAIENNISALIISNTTNEHRSALASKKKEEIGGLSGEPIQTLTTNLIKKFYKKSNGKIVIVGVGGINSGKSAYEKIAAGASLVQLYTGLIYEGPLLIKKIKKELIDLMKNDGIENINKLVGAKVT